MPTLGWVSRGIYRVAAAGCLGVLLALFVIGAVSSGPERAAAPAAPTGVIDLWGGGA